MISSSLALRRNQLAVATLFLVLGFNFSSWASRIPALKNQLALSAAEVGVLLLACGLGAVFSFPVTAVLLQRLGSRRLCMLTGALLPLLLLSLSIVENLQLAMLMMALEGLVVSCLNVAMNAQGVAVETLGQRAIMSRLHAVFSLGGLLGALFASAITSYSASLVLHFALCAALLWAAVILALPYLLADTLRAPAKALAEAKSGWRIVLPNRLALWLGAIAMCGTVVENSMSDWSALYLKEVVRVAPELAPLGIACVSGAMLLARWFGDGWRMRWGAQRMLTIGGALAGSGLAMALLLGGLIPALLGFALVGLGIAAVSPCVYTAAAKNGPVALASVTTMGSIGGLMGPPMIGFIAHASSFSWGMAVIALAAYLVAAATRKMSWD
ncbi:MFS transporter [Undibacterium sp.]|uniref:MFS transporter n=1 Tax=Undibacterium sp. TaxID=1914977 RepID=UPI0025EA8BCD|nr:MFS transporter [Undibacterium sp.]